MARPDRPVRLQVLLKRYSPECLERLSEKVHAQRVERGFGRYTEREEGLRVLCSVTLQAPPILFGQSLEGRL